MLNGIHEFAAVNWRIGVAGTGSTVTMSLEKAFSLRRALGLRRTLSLGRRSQRQMMNARSWRRIKQSRRRKGHSAW